MFGGLRRRVGVQAFPDVAPRVSENPEIESEQVGVEGRVEVNQENRERRADQRLEPEVLPNGSKQHNHTDPEGDVTECINNITISNH